MVYLLLLVWGATPLVGEQLPAQFDLRNVDGNNYVTKVKSQSGGTCWTFGTMAALESNLIVTRNWKNAGESGEPNLAEYHLDWWNGFNKHFNADISPSSGGLSVHQGGDYRVASAYLTRGQGAVRDQDGQSYSNPPQKKDSSYHYFYVRNIEWLQVGEDLENIDEIKTNLMNHGVMGTALTWSQSFFNSSNYTFYQPPSSSSEPNHAVAIVGWDDNKQTRAPQDGAWLIKNSWGSGWADRGYFWISYYDKVAGKHPEMGAVAFKNVIPNPYNHYYFHDYHGWRDTKEEITEAFNVFEAKGNPSGRETIKSVGFFTAARDVHYRIRVHRKFEAGKLLNPVSLQEGIAKQVGYHTVDLNWPVGIQSGEKFYVYLYLSKGGHPIDKTSNVPLLLGGSSRPIVKSKASPGESYYRKSGAWVDLTHDDDSANFCIKALSVFN